MLKNLFKKRQTIDLVSTHDADAGRCEIRGRPPAARRLGAEGHDSRSPRSA